MDVTSLITNYLPVWALVFGYGFTEVAKRIFSSEDGKVPRWLIAVPLVTGILLGYLDYFANTPTEALTILTIGKRIALATVRGLGYGGASVILWEVRKVFFKGKDGTELDKP